MKGITANLKGKGRAPLATAALMDATIFANVDYGYWQQYRNGDVGTLISSPYLRKIGLNPNGNSVFIIRAPSTIALRAFLLHSPISSLVVNFEVDPKTVSISNPYDKVHRCSGDLLIRYFRSGELADSIASVSTTINKASFRRGNPTLVIRPAMSGRDYVEDKEKYPSKGNVGTVVVMKDGFMIRDLADVVALGPDAGYANWTGRVVRGTVDHTDIKVATSLRHLEETDGESLRAAAKFKENGLPSYAAVVQMDLPPPSMDDYYDRAPEYA
ncbi:hypothetical protein BJ742DRAFT_846768 [Cladochytrium replicatum]|nr:hypothetical protein BJ742DRAFT_846768 [Cladochytrium replicatum]